MKFIDLFHRFMYDCFNIIVCIYINKKKYYRNENMNVFKKTFNVCFSSNNLYALLLIDLKRNNELYKSYNNNVFIV